MMMMMMVMMMTTTTTMMMMMTEANALLGCTLKTVCGHLMI
jgi:hypothetical protein